jgi:hypothetical protein
MTSSAPRQFSFPTVDSDPTQSIVSAVRDVVTDHEDGCQLLHRYNRAAFPNQSEWKSSGLLLAEYLASVEIGKLRNDVPE